MMQFATSAKYVPLRRSIWRAASAVLAGAITYFTLVSSQQGVVTGPWSDKIYHFAAFASLVLPTAVIYRRALYWVIPTALLFGGAIEVIQPYVGRQGEWMDFVADALGVVFGSGAGLLIRAVLSTRLQLR